jgi:hypothetical protein
LKIKKGRFGLKDIDKVYNDLVSNERILYEEQPDDDGRKE